MVTLYIRYWLYSCSKRVWSLFDIFCLFSIWTWTNTSFRCSNRRNCTDDKIFLYIYLYIYMVDQTVQSRVLISWKTEKNLLLPFEKILANLSRFFLRFYWKEPCLKDKKNKNLERMRTRSSTSESSRMGCCSQFQYWIINV